MANFEYIKDGNKYVFHYALDAVAADAPADDFSPKQAILVEVKKEDSDEKIAEYMAKFVNGQMTELKNTDGDVDVLSGNEDLGVKFMEAYTQKHTEAVQAARAESGRAAEDEDEALPIHRACLVGCVEAVQVLIEKGGLEQLSAQTAAGSLPISCAGQEGQTK